MIDFSGSSGEEIKPMFRLSEETIIGDGISGVALIGLDDRTISGEFRDGEEGTFGDEMTGGITFVDILLTVGFAIDWTPDDSINGFIGIEISGGIYFAFTLDFSEDFIFSLDGILIFISLIDVNSNGWMTGANGDKTFGGEMSGTTGNEVFVDILSTVWLARERVCGDRMNGLSGISSSGKEIFPMFSLFEGIITDDGVLGDGFIGSGISGEFRVGISGNAGDAIFGDEMFSVSKDEILRWDNGFLNLSLSIDGSFDNWISGKTRDVIPSDSGFCLATNMVFVVEGRVLLFRFFIIAFALKVLLISIWSLFSNSGFPVIMHWINKNKNEKKRRKVYLN